MSSLSGQCIVELSFLQSVQPVRPSRRGHAPVRIQEDPEAPYDEDSQDDEKENNESEGGFLLQRYTVVGRPQRWQQSGRGLTFHAPGQLKGIFPKCSLSRNQFLESMMRSSTSRPSIQKEQTFSVKRLYIL